MAEFYVIMGFIFALLVFLSWMMPSLMRPTLPFGVRIPGERTDEPVIDQELRRYRLLTILSGVVIGAIVAVVTLLTGWQETLTAGILVLIFVQWIWYYRAHRGIVAAKQAGNWFAGLQQGTVVDTAIRTEPQPYPWLWALPAIGLVVASAITGIIKYPDLPGTLAIHYNTQGVANGFASKSVWSAFSLVFLEAVTTALIVGISVLTFRSRQELSSEHPAVSAQQHRAFVRQMTQAVLFLAACVNVTMLFGSLTIWDVLTPTGPKSLLGLGLPIIVGVVGITALTIHTGQAGHRLPAAEGGHASGMVDRDDDRYWIGGVFYMNRDDPAFLVQKRFGVGWTFNFGHRGAWVILVITIGIAVVAPLVSALTKH